MRALVFVVLTVVLVPLSLSSSSAQPTAPARLLFGDYETLDPETDALVILAPRVGFSERASGQLDGFLRSGGRVLLAGLSGSGSELLARLDSGVVGAQGGLYSLATGGPPLVQGAGAWSDVEELVVPGARMVAGTGEPLLETHEYTWRDTDGDGHPDLGEARGRFAVAAKTSVGEGALLVVGTVRLVEQDAPPELQAHVEAWLHEDGPRRIVHDARHMEAGRLGTLGQVLAQEDVYPALFVATAAVVLVGVFGLRWHRRPDAPRRVRPLPPPRSPLEAQAVEELPR